MKWDHRVEEVDPADVTLKINRDYSRSIYELIAVVADPKTGKFFLFSSWG
jgi:hypothetical protein